MIYMNEQVYVPSACVSKILTCKNLLIDICISMIAALRRFKALSRPQGSQAPRQECIEHCKGVPLSDLTLGELLWSSLKCSQTLLKSPLETCVEIGKLTSTNGTDWPFSWEITRGYDGWTVKIHQNTGFSARNWGIVGKWYGCIDLGVLVECYIYIYMLHIPSVGGYSYILMYHVPIVRDPWYDHVAVRSYVIYPWKIAIF